MFRSVTFRSVPRATCKLKNTEITMASKNSNVPGLSLSKSPTAATPSRPVVLLRKHHPRFHTAVLFHPQFLRNSGDGRTHCIVVFEVRDSSIFKQAEDEDKAAAKRLEARMAGPFQNKSALCLVKFHWRLKALFFSNRLRS